MANLDWSKTREVMYPKLTKQPPIELDPSIRRKRDTRDPRRQDWNRDWVGSQFKEAFYIRACLLGYDKDVKWRSVCHQCNMESDDVSGEDAIKFLHAHAGHRTSHIKIPFR